MKSIISLLTTTVLIVGATSAMAYQRHVAHHAPRVVTSVAGAAASIQPGARASAVDDSQTEIRKQCAEEARARWGTNSQDMQRNRDFAASTCMFDHGVRNP
jgi:hypothetical protein